MSSRMSWRTSKAKSRSRFWQAVSQLLPGFEEARDEVRRIDVAALPRSAGPMRTRAASEVSTILEH